MSDAHGESEAASDAPGESEAARAAHGEEEAASDAPEVPATDRAPSGDASVRLPGTRADLFGAVAIIAGTAGLVFGPGVYARLSAHPSAAECDALLAHYVELKERAVTEKVDPKSYAAALENARRLAGPTFAACTTEVTLDEAECARKAGYADEMERCLR